MGRNDHDDFVDETVAVSRSRPGPRRRRSPEDTALDVPSEHEEPTEGSTVVAHRESRRRARGESVHEPVPVPKVAGRDARMPHPGPGDVYPVRAAAPVVAPRQAPAERPPQSPADTAVAEARLRSRARHRVIAVVAAASVTALAAAAVIIALVVAG
ncbi:hypothetical protein [Microbacterium immunditiarum]|uniref:Uncharacterized protein n=1 Tax=Microbacterium immunditiarum TaxID=337480 RepID=A0A7Y9KKY4_9MICO|nr:hypothetical protein [Microbacterium immunditiarum]NYE21340.1 hypothetical protein [Microbacterium immunditiarum]